VLRLLGRHEPFRDVEGVQEARAGGLHVESGGVLGAEQRLQIAGLGREQPVGRAGGHHEGVEVERREAGLLQDLLGGRLGHAGIGLVGSRHASLADPRALPDPLIRGVEDLGELVVRHHPFGGVAAGSQELRDRTLHRAAPPSASSAPMS